MYILLFPLFPGQLNNSHQSHQLIWSHLYFDFVTFVFLRLLFFLLFFFLRIFKYMYHTHFLFPDNGPDKWTRECLSEAGRQATIVESQATEQRIYPWRQIVVWTMLCVIFVFKRLYFAFSNSNNINNKNSNKKYN